MANTSDKVINIALAEVGYLEKSAAAYKKNPAILDSKTDGAGSDNYTKYGRDMHAIYPAVMDFPAYWCDCFVDWCFYKAYGVATAKSLLGGNFDDYTVASCQMYKNKGALDTTPSVGAQVFFTKNGAVSGCHHTGLVYAVDAKNFYTIEGNTSGASGVVSNGGGVAKKQYSITGYKGKVLFGHPKYDSASVTPTVTTTSTSTTKNSKVDDAEQYDNTLSGTYVVSGCSFLTFRTGAGTNKGVIGSLKAGTEVKNFGYYTVVNTRKWLYVQTKDGKTGYLSAAYLKKK